MFVGVDTTSTHLVIGTQDCISKASHHELTRLTKKRAYQPRYLHDFVVATTDYILKGAGAGYGLVG